MNKNLSGFRRGSVILTYILIEWLMVPEFEKLHNRVNLSIFV